MLLLLAAWTVGALYYALAPAEWLRRPLALLFVVVVIGLAAWPPTRRATPYVIGGAFAFALAGFLLLKPSNDRNWIAREAKTAWARLEGDTLTVHNVRNFHYRSEEDADERWEVRRYDLSGLSDVWFLLARFPHVRLGAHTFVSFEFEDGQFLCLSIEGRKEVGEDYGILRGLYRQFETMYIPGDERDLIGLRTHIRKHDVFLYPMRSTAEGRRAFLLDMIRRMNQLHEEPAFYNTLFDTCTTGLYEHLNQVREKPLPLSYEVLVSGLSDRRAYDLGLIDTELTFEKARQRHRIDPARAPIDAPDFSARLRLLDVDATGPGTPAPSGG